MKFSKEIEKLSLVLAVILFVSFSIFAQDAAPTATPSVPEKRDRIMGNPKAEVKSTPVETAKTDTPAQNVPDNKTSDTDKQAQTSDKKTEDSKTDSTASDTQNKKDGQNPVSQENSSDESAQVVNYYNNYLKEYHLGPEDVISVEVFGQPNYSKAGINIPPTATISYQLIPGGIFVGGKTTDQVGAEIAKKLSEYIIDPQVTVTLEKVGSARYAVMGDVAQPGIRLMTRRVTALSAITEAGGALATGSKSKVMIYRNNGTGGYTQVPVNIDAIMKGKANDIEIQPGDQVFIPGNKMKVFTNVLDTVSKLSAFRLLFGVPF